MNKFTGQIGRCGPGQYETEKGLLFLMLMEAIKLREETDYQPPRPNGTDKYDEEYEKEYLESCERAQIELEKLAQNIVLGLTGKKALLATFTKA